MAEPATTIDLAPEHAVALLEAIGHDASIGVGFWDADLRYRFINDALAEMNGRPREEHLGRSVREVLEVLADALEPLFRRILATGERALDVAIEGQTAAAPGVQRHWRGSYHPVRDASGAVVGIAGVVLEVSAERRARGAARTALREARAVGALLDAVFAAAPVGLGVWDTDLRFERVNAALAAMNGVPADEHLGHTPEEVLGPNAERIEGHLRTVLAAAQPVLDQTITVGDDEDAQHYEATYFPIPDVDGELAGAGAVVRDVTERHRAERERAQLLKDALTARAQAEAAQVRAEVAQREAEAGRVRTEFLARAGARMAASMDYETTLQEVAAAAVPAIADWCVITMLQADGTLQTLAAAHFDPARTRFTWELTERYPSRLDAPAGVGRVIRTGELELMEEIPDALLERAARDPEHLEILRALGLRSSLVVPLMTPERVIGAVTLIFAESGRRFGPEDVALARSLAARAALHTENARLYTERSHIARTLQRSLLPGSIPAIPGLAISARYLPVGEQNDVGGDFYDVFATEPGVWTALIGDVSGKGAEAAAITSLARHTLRAAAMRDPSPAANLQLLNDAMLADSTSSRFCTVAYTRLQPGEDGVTSVTFANGGHMPPLVARADGRLERVELPGSLIGALPVPLFSERGLFLAPGDLLLLYTDGLTDLRGRRSGEQRLFDTVRAHAREGADALVDAVTRMAVDAQGGQPRDDIAVLALRAGA